MRHSALLCLELGLASTTVRKKILFISPRLTLVIFNQQFKWTKSSGGEMLVVWIREVTRVMMHF